MKNIKTSQNIENNILTLKFFSKLLVNIEHFIFFGTLLGLTRDNSPIEGDDDIDFYVNINDQEKIHQILKDNKIIVDYSLWPNDTKYFNQVEFILNNKKLRADFYYYEKEDNDFFITERWNFEAKYKLKEHILKIPKVFIFPINKKKYKDFYVNYPNQPEVLCEYLYGSTWKSPLKKHEEYIIKVMGGKPYLFLKDKQNNSLKLLP